MLMAEGGVWHVAFLAVESRIKDLCTARKVRGVREGRE